MLHPDESRQAQPPTTLYTLALHPDGTRLATGGLDTKIRLWNTAPIQNQKDEENEDVPKLLSTLTSHSGQLAAAFAEELLLKLIWLYDRRRDVRQVV